MPRCHTELKQADLLEVVPMLEALPTTRPLANIRPRRTPSSGSRRDGAVIVFVADLFCQHPGLFLVPMSRNLRLSLKVMGTSPIRQSTPGSLLSQRCGFGSVRWVVDVLVAGAGRGVVRGRFGEEVRGGIVVVHIPLPGPVLWVVGARVRVRCSSLGLGIIGRRVNHAVRR